VTEPRQPPRPLAVDTVKVLLAGLAGLAVWAVALVVTLAVPSLHTGNRDWWPWACVAGLVIGTIGVLYLRRGRGNATAAYHD